MDRIDKIPRERGTLQDTLPKPYVPLLLFWIMCTATAVYTHYYSCFESVNSIEDIVIISSQAGLGVASSMYSVVYSDPFVHLISYTSDVSDRFLIIFVKKVSFLHMNFMYLIMSFSVNIASSFNPSLRRSYFEP